MSGPIDRRDRFVTGSEKGILSRSPQFIEARSAYDVYVPQLSLRLRSYVVIICADVGSGGVFFFGREV